MSGLLYYLLTFAESLTSVVGLRFPYEQPHYAVLQTLGHDAEIRHYDPSLAIQATIDDPDRGKAASEAFTLLFRYITGANQRVQKIAMTAPVQTQGQTPAQTSAQTSAQTLAQSQAQTAAQTPAQAQARTKSERIAMTVPVQTTSAGNQVAMRFFLPQSVAEAGAPAPLDPRLHLVQIPATTIAALRYSGVATQATRDQKAARLRQILAKTSWKPQGEVFQLNYDPPFTIPFLRRNEVAVGVTK